MDSPPLIIIAFVSVSAFALQVGTLKTSPVHLLHSTRCDLNNLSLQRSWVKTTVF